MVATTANQPLPPYDEIENIVTTVLNIFDGAFDQVDEDPENFIQGSNESLDAISERIRLIDSVLAARLEPSFQRIKEMIITIVDT